MDDRTNDARQALRRNVDTAASLIISKDEHGNHVFDEVIRKKASALILDSITQLNEMNTYPEVIILKRRHRVDAPVAPVEVNPPAPMHEDEHLLDLDTMRFIIRSRCQMENTTPDLNDNDWNGRSETLTVPVYPTLKQLGSALDAFLFQKNPWDHEMFLLDGPCPTPSTREFFIFARPRQR